VFAAFMTFMKCRRGASAAEYALLLGVICSILVVAATALGSAINAPMDAAATQLAP
jgi:Flp pilus assembly pilin Flp